MPISTRTTGRPVLNATRARQGRFGRHVFWVLLISTALAAIALFGAWTWRAPDLARSNNSNGPSQDARAFDMGEPAAQQKPGSPDRPHS